MTVSSGFTSQVRSLARALRDRVRHRLATPCAAPLLVTGNQKSGTTVIGFLLAALTGRSYCNDPFNQDVPFVLPAIGRGRISMEEYIRSHQAHFAHGVVKDPNFPFVAEGLHACFPEASFAWIIRDPRENIRSILNRLGLQGDLDVPDETVVNRLQKLRGWSLYFDPSHFSIGGDGWIETLGRRWLAVARIAARMSSKSELLRYEDFVADKVGAIRNLARELGHDPCQNIEHLVNQQFQPKGDHTVTALNFFGPRNLEMIESICAPMMDHFGYSGSKLADECSI